MRKKYIIILYLISSVLFGQQREYLLKDVVISAGKTPVGFNNLARSVVIITSEEIQKLPSNNLIDLLKYISSIDIKTRGAEGIQADVGIRGSTFEQTLFLIDGIKISDPQTAHHNFNIPISLNNIERIEVLKGQGSRIFGPNAFGGAINIITKKLRDNQLSFSTLGGQHSLYELEVNGSHSFESLNNNISLSRKKSDGYTHNTNFEIINFSFNPNYSSGKNTTNLFIGYVDKIFGANNFYSDLYPNQWEHTTTKIVNLSSSFYFNDIIISSKTCWRRNDDDYILDNTRPDWYRNIHKTNSYGAEIQAMIETSFGKTSFGGELGKEEIVSSNLGNHFRTRGGIFGEHAFQPFKDFFVSAGFFAYNHTDIGWKLWPGVDVSYNFSKFTKTYFSYGNAFRIPNFTELYYISPANIGNPNLIQEEITNFEAGFVYNDMFIEGGVSIFYKEGNNIIDWVRSSINVPWKVENVTEINTTGLEFSFSFSPNYIWLNSPFTKISFHYTYLSSDRKTGLFESKYLLDYLRHQLKLELSHYFIWGLHQNWSLRYNDRENYKSHFILDTQLTTNEGPFNIFLRATNLFNKSHQDFPGVQLPGRWISAGMKYSLQY